MLRAGVTATTAAVNPDGWSVPMEQALKEGKDVLVLTFSSGLISAAPRTIDGVKYVQHEAPISTGNSGGPLINKYGEVIGINTMYVNNAQNLNFAIHLSELDNLDYSTP